MDYITSSKFRVFLAENAINYTYVANVPANVVLKDNNIGCPNISFGPGIHSPLLVDVGCEMYEYMATRTLDKIIHFFEGGQEVILRETVVEPPETEDEALDALGNWDDLKAKLESGRIDKLLEVGIGAGADDSEWYRHK